MTTITTAIEDLIELCKAGDRKAQYQLYQQYTKAMYNVAVRIVKDTAEAQDVLQEAFVKAFKQLGSFKGSATFGAWLKRIVVNTSINHLRKRRETLWEGEDIPEPTVDYSPEPGESRWNMQQIQTAISQLPEGYRIVFSLYLIEGYDHGEIAQILGISEATSKSQYSRARQKLRTTLSNIEI